MEDRNPIGESPISCALVLFEKSNLVQYREILYEGGEGLKFILLKEGKDTGITFRAVPGGHEFTSLLMAVLNAEAKERIFRTSLLPDVSRRYRGRLV